MEIETEDLAGKVILEVGSGRGDTTRALVKLLVKARQASLIVTDSSDTHFERLEGEFKGEPIRIRFIPTSACDLKGVDNHSVDDIVCNYTLCAVNSQTGSGSLALKRFWEVLKVGGKLFIEEEYPTSRRDTQAQAIWSDKWRILKAALVLSGGFPYTEYSPEVLAEICQMAGFKQVRWSSDITQYEGQDVLAFFQSRLQRLMASIPNENLRIGFSELATELQERVNQIGKMEVPYYRMTAEKV